jgi:putative ABC transport system permease protein
MRALLRALKSLVRRARFEREMRDELRFHIDRRADDLIASGVSPTEALRRARVEFGALESLKEQCRDESGFAPLRPLHGIGGDLKLAVRRLAATPLFTTFAVLSLAVGLGVTTAAYSVVASLFFAPSGVADEDRVVKLATRWEGNLVAGGTSQPDYEDIRAAQTSFSHMTASAGLQLSVATPTSTDLMRAEAVDGSYFETLGVRAALGRTIDVQDVAGAHAVVILSHALWSLRFEADPGVVGREIHVAGRPFEVIGIAPEGFVGREDLLSGTRMWIPLTADPRATQTATADRDRGRLVVIGRLAPDTTLQTASAQLAAIGTRLAAAYPRRNAVGPVTRDWAAKPFDARDGQAVLRQFGFAFVGLVALVLVVACTNLANLVLARGTARRQELAVRRAIGASRWRLVREQCAESLLLAAMGAAGAWLVFSVVSVLVDIDVPLTSKMLISFKPEIDTGVLVVASLAMLLSLLVFGLEPALRLTRGRALRPDLSSASGSVGVPQAKRQRRLVRWQVAISTGFFVLATLSVNYIAAEARHDSGVDLDRVALATMNFWTQQWDDSRARRALARVLEGLEQDPQVQSAAVTTGVPFGASNTARFTIAATDRSITDRTAARQALVVAATPRIFQTLGVSIVRGRGFDDRDTAGAALVVVLSEQTAKRLFGTADVVGRQVQLKPSSSAGPRRRSVAGKLSLQTTVAPPPAGAEIDIVTVIGVAADTDVGQIFSRRGDLAYLPLSQQPTGVSFGIAIVRTTGDPYVALRVLRDVIRRVDPDLAVESAGTGLGALGGPAVFLRTASLMAVSLGGLTLLLAMVGLHGVQSHGVTERTREFGVRMSFGSTAAQIRGLVLKDGCRPVVEGLAIGLFLGFVGRGVIRAFWWNGMAIIDPWMLIGVPVPLLLAAFFACWLPARRASQVDPMVALRHL